MAQAKVESTVEKLEKVPVVESVYSVEELATNAESMFHTKYECVKAALKASGITEVTLNKAKEIVNNYMKMEVK